MGHFWRKKGVLIIWFWNQLKWPYPGFNNEIKTSKILLLECEELDSWTGGQQPSTTHIPDLEMILTSPHKSRSRCGWATARCKSTPTTTCIPHHLHTEPMPLSELRLLLLCVLVWPLIWSGTLLDIFSTLSSLSQHYPATGGERRSRWSPRRSLGGRGRPACFH